MGLLYFLLTGLFIVGTSGHAYDYNSGYMNESVSKYDTQVSKYDVGYQTFRFKPNDEKMLCEETALKEREAILADIKSGRMKMKKHPDFKSGLFLSPDFATGREYIYFGSFSECRYYLRQFEDRR